MEPIQELSETVKSVDIGTTEDGNTPSSRNQLSDSNQLPPTGIINGTTSSNISESDINSAMSPPPQKSPSLNPGLDCMDSLDDYDDGESIGANTQGSFDLGLSSDDKSSNYKTNGRSRSPNNTTLPDANRTPVELFPGFVIEVYVLDRQGRRLQDAKNPDRDPPPLCRLKDGCNLVASTKSGTNLDGDTNVNLIDTELEARLLNLGRPLPCQIALYGWTTWGKTPLQCAVADGTLTERNVSQFCYKFLTDDAIPRVTLDEMMIQQEKVAEQAQAANNLSSSTFNDTGGQTPISTIDQKVTSSDSHAETASAAAQRRESTASHAFPEESGSLKCDGSSPMDFVSPQLTSLRTEGRSLTLRELVQFGYLEPVSKRVSVTALSDKISATGRSNIAVGDNIKRGTKTTKDLPHSNVFAIEIMFDEMRTGLQRKMPDIRASVPHGDGSSVFAVTDDVPVDVRVDLINLIKVDLDDAFFEADFDITFSWLTRMAPFEVDEKLYQERQNNSDSTSMSAQALRDSYNATHEFDDGKRDNLNDAGDGEGAMGSAKRHSRKLWRPHWKFNNRINDEGEVLEKIYVSERQKMSRGMRLAKEIVDSYWPVGNPTRQENIEATEEAAKKLVRGEDKESVLHTLHKSSLQEASRYNLKSKMNLKEKQDNVSVAESFDMLTRRTMGIKNTAATPSKILATGGGGGAFETPSNLSASTTNSAEEGVEGCTEIVFKVSCRSLRFSLELKNLDNFPFDTLSLPIFIGFREPMGIYQAQIARTLNGGDSRKSTSQRWVNQDVTSDEEYDSEDEEGSNKALDRSSERLGRLHIADRLKAKRNLREMLKLKKQHKVFPSNHSDSVSTLSSGSAERQSMRGSRFKIVSDVSEDVLAVTANAANGAMSLIYQTETDSNAKLLDMAQSCLKEIGETDGVAIPSFRPAIDFIPIPGRMRLRVSNDYNNQGVAEHRLRSMKWGIEDLYVQKSKSKSDASKYDAFMQINVRAESVHELEHRWANPVMAVRVHVHRKSTYVLQYIYLPLFLMTFVSFHTILVGYGMELVSAFGDRCSITLTLLLTVVATELPEHLKEVKQVKNLKKWAFQFICFMIFKDIVATVTWWPTIYWHSGKIAEMNPFSSAKGFERVETLMNGFYSKEKFPWWHRIWFIDGMLTIVAFFFWLRKFLTLCIYPRTTWESQQTAPVVRFEAKKSSSHLLKPGSYLRQFVLERAANFLHDRWRAGYALQCKKTYLAAQREKQKRKDAAANASYVPIKKSVFLSTPNKPNISKKASAMWLTEQLGKGALEIQPRWKREIDFQNPPASVTPPKTRNHGDIGAPGRWFDKENREWYVNIDQKLENLPQSAMLDNLKTADQVISMLESTPHAPRTVLADKLHRKWLEGQDLDEEDKLYKPWSELPQVEKDKNMVIINAVLDLCALAYQVNTTVSSLFNRDGDNLVSSEEFLMGDSLRPLFHNNVRVPIRKGDIVRVKDTCKNTEVFKHAVVIGWQQRSHWNHKESHQSGALKRSSTLHVVDKQDKGISVGPMFSSSPPTSDAEGDDEDPEDFEFHGTVFLVRFFTPKDRAEFTSGTMIPRPQSPAYNKWLTQGEIHAVPETSLCWKSIRCDEFVKAILAHSDWLFDSDGRCAVNDHRCVAIAKGKKNKILD